MQQFLIIVQVLYNQRNCFLWTLVGKTPSTLLIPEVKCLAYTYASPMEKHLAKITAQISQKELKILDSKREIDDMTGKLDSVTDHQAKFFCSHCHTSHHCISLCMSEMCTTALACGKLK